MEFEHLLPVACRVAPVEPRLMVDAWEGQFRWRAVWKDLDSVPGEGWRWSQLLEELAHYRQVLDCYEPLGEEVERLWVLR